MTRDKQINKGKSNRGTSNELHSSTKEDARGSVRTVDATGNTTRANNRRNSSNSSKRRLNDKGRHNDPNWYFTDTTLADQVSAISFDSYLGVPTDIDVKLTTITDVAVGRTSIQIPSIITYQCNPCPGNTESIQHGINVAALKNYSMLSSLNAKTTGYAPQDLTMLTLALGEIVSIIEHLRRAFGVAFTYNARNRDVPYYLIQEMGIDPDTFLANLADNRLALNASITAVNKLPFVTNIAYIAKCRDMYQHVYLDTESPMAQIFMQRPISTWKLNETYNDQGSGLETITLDGVKPFSFWIDTLNDMIEQLFTSSTFNFIYSDVLNYANKTGATLFALDLVEEGYSVVPEFNLTACLQMHNAIIVGEPSLNAASDKYTKLNDVSCSVDHNKIVYHPLFSWDGRETEPIVVTSPIVDFMSPNPSVEDKIEATRYTAILDMPEVSKLTAGSLPDHFISGVNVYNGTGLVSTLVSSCLRHEVDILESMSRIPMAAIDLMKVDWAPIFYVVTDDPTEDDLNNLSMQTIGDFNFFTTLNLQWFERVNDICFQALFSMR